MARSKKEKKSPADTVRGKRPVNPERKPKAVRKITKTPAIQPDDNSRPDIQDTTRLEKLLKDSEVRYRRLFETAQDAILILDGDSGQILDANPFIKEMLGYTTEEMVGKNLWEIGLFKDIVANKDSFDELKKKGYIRYEHLPLEAKDGRHIDVEFVSNRYKVNSHVVFQCNIRDITERKKVEKLLKDSEVKYRRLFETAQDAILILEGDTGQILDANPFIKDLLGYTIEEMVGKNLWEIGLFKDIVANKDSFDELKKKGYIRYEHLPLETKDGRHIDVEFVSNRYRVNSHNVFQCNIRDITERKKVEKQLIVINRLYTLLSTINQAIVRIKNRDDLFKSLCRIAVETGKFRMAWIGLIDNQSGSLQREAWYGHEEGYLETILISIEEEPDTVRPTLTAISQGKIAVSNDIEAEIKPRPWRDEALKRGYRSFAAIPLKIKNKVIGNFNIYSDTTGFFSNEEKRLLEEIGDDISYALDSMEIEKERQKAEKDLHKLNKLFEEIQAMTRLGGWEYDLGTRELIWSKEVYRIYGVSEEHNPSDIDSDISFYSPEDRTKIESAFKRAVELGEPYDLELKFNRATGEQIWVRTMGTPVMANGKVVRVTGNFMDITDRKQMEEGLKASEAKYHAIFNNAAEGVFQSTLEGKYISVNPAFARIEGYNSPEDVINSVGDIQQQMYVHPEDRTRLIELVNRQGSVSNFECEVRRKDGSVIWLSINIRAVKDGNGKIMYLEGTIEDITQRKRAEHALRESEERFSIAFHNSPIGITINHLKDGIFIVVNDAFLQMCGYEREEVIGHSSTELQLVSADNRNSFVNELRQQGKILNRELALRTKTGEIRQISFSGQIITMGGDTYSLGLNIDITERRKLQQRQELTIKLLGIINKHRNQQQIIREIMLLIKEFSGCEAVGIRLRQGEDFPYYETNGFTRGHVAAENRLCAIDQSGNIIRDSQGAPILECMCGNIICGRFDSAQSFFTKKGSFWTNSTTELLASTTEADRQARTRNKCNGEGYESVALIPLNSEEGIIGLLQLNDSSLNRFTRDIIEFYEGIGQSIGVALERLITEQELEESEEKFRLLMENANDAIFIHEVSLQGPGKFIQVNEKACAMLGYTREELVQMSIPDIDVPEQRDRIPAIIEKLYATGQAVFETEHLCKDGSRVPVEISTRLIKIRGRDLIFSIVRDITDRKHLEEERLRIDKLQSVGILAGGIAHDFNNILTAILGNINLASIRLARGENAESLLKEAETASLRAKGLTQQLLTFAQGGMPIKKIVSIGNLIKETAGFALRGSNVNCRFSIPDDLWLVDADEGQINQVINNLVINARQAMPMGGAIEIKAENINLNEGQTLGRRLPLKTGDYVRITVTDHGIGIPAQYIDQIFDPYYTTKQTGSGLGLATSFSIIRNHQGHIGVESVVNEGTTFYVYLPASEKQAVAAAGEQEIDRPAFTGRILVMDDEDAIRDVAGAMLRHIGFSDVTLTVNGQQAVNEYQAAMKAGKPFAVVILDLTIPGGMGGRETIQKLLEIDPGVKAIVSSGYSGEDITAEYQKYGFKGIVSKPYTMEQLSDALGKVIGGDSASA